MTERFESLFDLVKERFANPLIFSFIFSWLVYNWRVPIALFWFDKDDLKAKGYTNLIDFIYGTLQSNDVWYIPLAIGLLYTLLMPVFKMLLEWFNAFILKKTNTQLFRITGETPISLKELHELRIKYDEEVNKLASERNQAKEKDDKLANSEANRLKEQDAHAKTVESLNKEIEKQKGLTGEVNQKFNLLTVELSKMELKIESIKRPIAGIWLIKMNNSSKFYQFLIGSELRKNRKDVFRSQPVTQIIVISTFNVEDQMIIIGTLDLNSSHRICIDVVKREENWIGFLNNERITMTHQSA